MSKANVEAVKAESRGLRGSLADEFANSEAFLTDEAKVLIKFHGSYQQEDRDARKNKDKAEGVGKPYQFMIRSRIPGGQMRPASILPTTTSPPNSAMTRCGSPLARLSSCTA